MSFASFIDMIMVVVKFFLQVQNMSLPTSSASSSAQWWIEFINEWRDLLTFLMPNVGAKRALFNLKIQTIPQCKLLLDAIEISTSATTNTNNRNATLELINKHKSLSSNTNTNNGTTSNDWQSKGFDWQEPGIGKFLFMNFTFILVSCLLIALIEMNVFDWLWSQLFKKMSFSFFKRKQQQQQQSIQMVSEILYW